MHLPLCVGEPRMTDLGPAVELVDARGQVIGLIFGRPQVASADAAQTVYAVNAATAMQAGPQPAEWVYPDR